MTFDCTKDRVYIQDPKALDDAGVRAIEVAHGDGLSGGSFNYGFGAHTDWEWIEAVADVLSHSNLTTLILPGVGTADELRRAYDLGVWSVRVATHCTEADVSKQHIGIARDLGMDVSGFLMMSHMIPANALAQQALLMESYGAHCVYVTDSGSALDMDGVRDRFQEYDRVLKPETERGMCRRQQFLANPSHSGQTGAYSQNGRKLMIALAKFGDSKQCREAQQRRMLRRTCQQFPSKNVHCQHFTSKSAEKAHDHLASRFGLPPGTAIRRVGAVGGPRISAR